MKYKIVWLLCLSIYVWGAEQHLASFSCENIQKDSIEDSICANKTLCKLDNYVAQLYKSFYLITPELKEAQEKWIKKRNLCQKTNQIEYCIRKSYENRIKILENSLVVQEEFSKDMLDIIRSLHKRKQTESDNESPQCMRFFNDLFLFQNIHVVKPILDHVDYNNTKLKKALGSCWDMNMNKKEYLYDSVDSFSLWNSDVDGDKKKELLFGRNDPSKISNTKIYILDKDLCDYMMRHPDLKKYKVMTPMVFDGYMQGNEKIVLEYQGKGYTFTTNIYRTPSALTDPSVTDIVRKNELIMDKGVIGNVRGKGCEYHEKRIKRK